MINYAFLVGLGCSLGLFYVAQQAAPKERGKMVDGGLLFLSGCLIGARLAYCVLHKQYFTSHLGEVFQFWQGGLFWPGAAIGGLGMLVFFRLESQAPWTKILDGLGPLAATLAISAWLGCWQSGVAYGASMSADSWWGLICIDENGEHLTRFPLLYIASLCMLFITAWLEIKTPFGTRPGTSGLMIILCLALILVGISFLRADLVPTWGGLPIDTWSGLALALGCGAAAGWLNRPINHSDV